jgi:hypothetical protein
MANINEIFGGKSKKYIHPQHQVDDVLRTKYGWTDEHFNHVLTQASRRHFVPFKHMDNYHGGGIGLGETPKSLAKHIHWFYSDYIKDELPSDFPKFNTPKNRWLRETNMTNITEAFRVTLRDKKTGVVVADSHVGDVIDKHGNENYSSWMDMHSRLQKIADDNPNHSVEVHHNGKKNIIMPKKRSWLGEARMPLEGHPYHQKSDAELRYIIKDAGEAAKNMRGMGNTEKEAKYLDQINDASTILHYRGLAESLNEGRFGIMDSAAHLYATSAQDNHSKMLKAQSSGNTYEAEKRKILRNRNHEKYKQVTGETLDFSRKNIKESYNLVENTKRVFPDNLMSGYSKFISKQNSYNNLGIEEGFTDRIKDALKTHEPDSFGTYDTDSHETEAAFAHTLNRFREAGSNKWDLHIKGSHGRRIGGQNLTRLGQKTQWLTGAKAVPFKSTGTLIGTFQHKENPDHKIDFALGRTGTGGTKIISATHNMSGSSISNASPADMEQFMGKLTRTAKGYQGLTERRSEVSLDDHVRIAKMADEEGDFELRDHHIKAYKNKTGKDLMIDDHWLTEGYDEDSDNYEVQSNNYQTNRALATKHNTDAKFHKSQRDKATNREDWNKHNENYESSKYNEIVHNTKANQASHNLDRINRQRRRFSSL